MRLRGCYKARSEYNLSMPEEPETPASGEAPEEQPMNYFVQNDDGSWSVGN